MRDEEALKNKMVSAALVRKLSHLKVKCVAFGDFEKKQQHQMVSF